MQLWGGEGGGLVKCQLIANSLPTQIPYRTDQNAVKPFGFKNDAGKFNETFNRPHGYLATVHHIVC